MTEYVVITGSEAGMPGEQGEPGEPGGGGASLDATIAADISAISSTVSGRYIVTDSTGTLTLGAVAASPGIVIELFFATPPGGNIVITATLGDLFGAYHRLNCNGSFPTASGGTEETITLSSWSGGGRITLFCDGDKWNIEGQVKCSGAWSGGF